MRKFGACVAACSASLSVLSACLFLDCTPAYSAEPVIAHIDSLWTSDQRDAAVVLLEQELPRARAVGDSAIVSRLLVMKGAYNNFLGNGRVAEAALLEGVALARTRQDSALVMSGLRWLGLVVGNNGRRGETMVLYQEMMDLALALGDRRHQAWAHVGLAWANWRDGEARIALEQYERASELFVGTGDVQGELWANNGVAAVSADLGRYDRAAAGYLATIEVARSHDQPVSEAIALNNLGTLEYSLGRSDVAVGHFRRARALNAGSRSRRQEIAPLFNIALCQNDMGQPAAARRTLDEALAICDEYDYRDLRSRTLVKIANLELQQRRLNRAEELIREAESDPETMMVMDIVEAGIELGKAYRLQGDLIAAERQFARADSILGDKQFSWVRLRLKGHQARVFRDLGEYQRALDRFLDLAEDATRLEMPEYRLTALAEAAWTCRLMDRPDEARVLYEKAASAWEEDRRQLLEPRWRERRGTRGRAIFTDLAVLFQEAGDPRGAFDRVQSYKSRTLLERMLGPGEALTRSLDETGRSCARLGDLQNLVLEEDELFLDFTMGPRVSVLFAVTRDTLVMRQLPASDRIAGRVHPYYDLLKDPDAASPAAVSAVGEGLWEMLLSDLPLNPADWKHIIVAPDGVLNLLPFAEMVAGARGKEWIRVPSASVLMKLREDERGTRDAVWTTLAVASDWGPEKSRLSGARLEVERLARDYERVNARLISGRETGLPSFAGYDILHLAAHASNDDQSPWQSAIRFFSDEQGGYLRAADVLELDLDARLAVLSSCSSGTGNILNGEGVLGLSTAFLSAGVPAVLAPLWAVDDGATAQFMQLYYGFLADGQDCARALTSAQESLRAQPGTGHPYYWAGFVLIGDGSLQPRMVRSREWFVPASLGLLAFGLLMSVGLSRRRHRSVQENRQSQARIPHVMTQVSAPRTRTGARRPG